VVVDPVQVSRAKLAGASGITLRYALNTKETTRALIDLVFGLGMEPIVQVGGSAGWLVACAVYIYIYIYVCVCV
jgi:indole-3-glycerol phosphate synthase